MTMREPSLQQRAMRIAEGMGRAHDSSFVQLLMQLLMRGGPLPTFKGKKGPFSKLVSPVHKAKELPIGHVSTRKDGSKWKKTAPGKWSEVTESSEGDHSSSVVVKVKPHESLGMREFDLHAELDGKDKVKISPHKGGSGPTIPRENLPDLINDLRGVVVGEQHKSDKRINSVISGKAKFLGKGDDGLAFKDGDTVVKVSTTVPFQPFNPGHRTKPEAVQMLRKQAELGNELADKGVPTLTSEFVEHDGRGYQIKPFVEIPKKLTRAQLDEAQNAIHKLHEAGYSLNDTVQVGVDSSGKVVLYDIGKAAPHRGSGVMGSQASDMDNLRLLYSDHGEPFENTNVSEQERNIQKVENTLDSLFFKTPEEITTEEVEKLVSDSKKAKADMVEHIKSTMMGDRQKKELSALNFRFRLLDSQIGAFQKDVQKGASAGNYTKPKLRERLKAKIMAGTKGGKAGQWSARKAQLLAQQYEAEGGGYRGRKTKKQRSLSTWSKQKWTTPSGKPSGKTGEVYAPKRAIAALQSTKEGRKKLKQATKKKRQATKQGRQYADHGLHEGKDRSNTEKSLQTALDWHLELYKGAIEYRHMSKAVGAPAGYEPVPGSKHGGFRKKVGSGYDYWYPSQGHADKAAKHHDKQARRAKRMLGLVMRLRNTSPEKIEAMLDKIESHEQHHEGSRDAHREKTEDGKNKIPEKIDMKTETRISGVLGIGRKKNFKPTKEQIRQAEEFEKRQKEEAEKKKQTPPPIPEAAKKKPAQSARDKSKEQGKKDTKNKAKTDEGVKEAFRRIAEAEKKKAEKKPSSPAKAKPSDDKKKTTASLNKELQKIIGDAKGPIRKDPMQALARMSQINAELERRSKEDKGKAKKQSKKKAEKKLPEPKKMSAEQTQFVVSKIIERDGYAANRSNLRSDKMRRVIADGLAEVKDGKIVATDKGKKLIVDSAEVEESASAKGFREERERREQRAAKNHAEALMSLYDGETDRSNIGGQAIKVMVSQGLAEVKGGKVKLTSRGRQLAKMEKGVGVNERVWSEAKKLARKQGQASNYAYIMGIYKRLQNAEGVAGATDQSKPPRKRSGVAKATVIAKAEACPLATQNVQLNTKNRNSAIKSETIKYGPLNIDEPGDYWSDLAEHWDTTEKAAKKSLCGNCVAFDISPRMEKCMPGEVSDDSGRLGFCWMHNFKCHSARTCYTWAKGGPITKDDVSEDWQDRADG